MPFKFVPAAASGSTQEILSRLVVEVQSIDLTDTVDSASEKSVPLDGIDDSFFLTNPIALYDIGSNTAAFEDVAIDLWIKPTITGNERSVFFDVSLMKSISATTSAYDGIYSLHMINTGGDIYLDFRMDHGEGYEHSLTSLSPLTADTWQHIYVDYLSASQQSRIYINGDYNRSGTINDGITGLTGAAIGVSDGIRFGGVLDEIRLWACSGASTSMDEIAKAVNIGVAPEGVTPTLRDFTPSADCMVGWWRLDSVSAFQLFTNLANTIEDYTDYDHNASPTGFEGADVVSEERTVIAGISASGASFNYSSGSLDKGALTVVDYNNGRIRLEPGSENLINEAYNTWTATGSGVAVNNENVNIYYGSSSVRVNAGIDKGVYQDISISSLIYDQHTYTMSLRYRPVTGSISAQVSFKVGDSINSVTAVGNPNYWTPVTIKTTMDGGSSTGRIEVKNHDASALFRLDGLQVIEGDNPSSFQAHSWLRKPSQLTYEVID